MDNDFDLPADVIAEIEANRKIAAVKLLREHRGMDLKDAKEQVDAYVEQHSASTTPPAPTTDSGIGRIVLLAIGVGLIYGLYRFFT